MSAKKRRLRYLRARIRWFVALGFSPCYTEKARNYDLLRAKTLQKEATELEKEIYWKDLQC